MRTQLVLCFASLVLSTPILQIDENSLQAPLNNLLPSEREGTAKHTDADKAMKEEHGDKKKEGEHTEAKKAEHVEKKEGEHAEAKKEEHKKPEEKHAGAK